MLAVKTLEQRFWGNFHRNYKYKKSAQSQQYDVLMTLARSAFTCSKSKMDTPDPCEKYVQR